MKRKCFSLLLICILLVAFLSSCNAEPNSLTDCGKEVISLMAEMLENDNYKSLYSLSSDAYSDAYYDEEISKLREGDYSKPTAVYELSVSEETLLCMIDADFDKSTFSEDLYDYLYSSAYVSFASFINQRSGTKAMAVSSVFVANKSFADSKMNENTIYLYVFESGRPIIVSFTTYGNGAFRAYGCFVINDEFITDNESSIKGSCEDLGIRNVNVERR